jgi:hypothetical protein
MGWKNTKVEMPEENEEIIIWDKGINFGELVHLYEVSDDVGEGDDDQLIFKLYTSDGDYDLLSPENKSWMPWNPEWVSSNLALPKEGVIVAVHNRENQYIAGYLFNNSWYDYAGDPFVELEGTKWTFLPVKPE